MFSPKVEGHPAFYTGRIQFGRLNDIGVSPLSPGYLALLALQDKRELLIHPHADLSPSS
jgi:hypothetical protein